MASLVEESSSKTETRTEEESTAEFEPVVKVLVLIFLMTKLHLIF